MRHTCGCDGEDAIGVNVKLDLNLRDATGCRGNAVQAEVAQRLVVPHELTLTCATRCTRSLILSLRTDLDGQL